MNTYDPNLQASIPAEIVEAAERVRKYFAQHNCKDWNLCGIQGIDEAVRTLAALVLSAGGEICVSADTMQRVQDLTLTRTDNPFTGDVMYSVAQITSTPPKPGTASHAGELSRHSAGS